MSDRADQTMASYSLVLNWLDRTIRLPGCDRHSDRHRWWCPACDFETEEQVNELCARRRQLMPEVERLRAALAHIADDQECEHYTGPPYCRDPRSGRMRDAQYGADRWCDTCIARDALGTVTDG